ncbi:MAG TPA: hypothetical protein DCZ95_05750 [Verrucomicrobia bacterium]|nr:MAG: hypothetical protein A2X46_09970 [Lentisphaerae bacterium GWF2_57_35]HBA83581.1 hypothetical protein [Verrucomicrobiota bacterium]
MLVWSVLAQGKSPDWSSKSNVVTTVATDKIPSSWFYKAKGYEKALELQKETGADIFIVFTRDVPTDQKGLCEWFQQKSLENNKVKKYLKNYLRVEIPLPANPDCQKLAEQFQVGKCPAVFIVQPKGWKQYCKVFSWDNKKPELIEPEALIDSFRTRSSSWYSMQDSESKQ